MALNDFPAAVPVPTLQQQQVLDRILVQRERLRARRAAALQARAVAQASAPAQGAARIDPAAPLALRLLAFARLHPVVVAAAALGVAAAAGPRRVVRWAGVVLPMVLRMRRG